MLPKFSCFVFRSLMTTRKLPITIHYNNFSMERNQVETGLKFRSSLLLKPQAHRQPRQYFRAKKDKPSSEPSVSRVQARRKIPVNGRKNASNESINNFWTFAIKIGAYTVGFATLTFGGCALWQQKNIENQEQLHKYQLEKKSRKKNDPKNNSDLAYMWNHLPMVHKVTYAIIGLNLMVWAGWKIVNPQTMMRWFTLSLNGSHNHLRSMFLSMFSHKSFLHFYLNMYVLNSFCAAWDRISMKGNANSNGHERFVAFYLTAGMCSSMLSIMVKFLGKIPHPSLGASGAIMGLIGYVCEKMPNTRLGIVFLPNWTFSAHSAKNFIIAFDTIGLIVGAMTRWRYIFFDHAGHLGGILFGMWYARGGEQLLNDFSEYIMRLNQGKR